jgi:ABC-type nitrate/sulfonate/bicarbonate transport system substrate-binding protein
MTTTTTPAVGSRQVTALWYTRCPVPAASGIAVDNGWLAEEFAGDGISVASLRASTSADVRESHFDHTQTDSFREGGNIPPIWTRARGSDARLIGMTWDDQYQAIVTLPGTGIEGPEDLKGRRLGITRHVNDQIDFWHASALRGFHTALSSAGLRLSDAQIVDVVERRRFVPAHERSRTRSLFGAYTTRQLQSAEVLALLRGEVDAIYIAGGRGPDLAAFADTQIVFDIAKQPDWETRISNLAPTTLTVSGPLLDDRRDLVIRYVATAIRAARWAQRHEAETRRILAHEVGIAEDFVAPGFGDDVHAHLEPVITEQLIEAINLQQAFLLQHGYIGQRFDTRAWIEPGVLADAHDLLGS